MSPSPEPGDQGPTLDSILEVEETARQFETLWESALRGGPIPDTDSILSGVEPSLRAGLEARLRSIEERYRARLDETAPGSVRTGEWQTDPESNPSAVTLDSEPGTTSTERDRSRQPRAEVAGYEILGELGRGGMGVVYLARQEGLDRLVALKMILAGGHASASDLDRFRAEARAVTKLQHPNIVQIFEVGEQDGLPFFSLEYVDGSSLEDERAGKPLDPERAARLVSTLAVAVQEAHGQGIVHRDLKPGNVLLTQAGLPKVTDFGLVKRLDDSSATGTGTIMGTPSYMAPEQARGDKSVGPRADVYSLGAILYTLLTGRPPFLGDSVMGTIRQVLEEEAIPPKRLQPDVPTDLDTICSKCLEKSPERRYPSAKEFGLDLERYLKGEPIQARAVSKLERAWRWCGRNRALAATGATVVALLLALLVGGWLSAIRIDRERETALANEHLAKDNERKADRAKRLAQNQETLAREKEAEAASQRDLAKTQRDIAIQALDTLAHESQKYLFDVPRTQTLQRRLLHLAMEKLNEITAKGGESFDSDLTLARAHRRFGDLLMEVGDFDKAHDQYAKCHAVVQRMAKKGHPTKPAVPFLNLGRSFEFLGRARLRAGKTHEAEKLFEQSLAAREKALPLGNDKFLCELEIAKARGALGDVAMALGEPAKARDHYTATLDVRKRWAKGAKREPAVAKGELAGSYIALGRAHLHLDQREESLAWYDKARAILEELNKRKSSDVSGEANLAVWDMDVGDVHLFTKHTKEAKTHYKAAVDRLLPHSKNDPENESLRRSLSSALYRMGVVELELGNKPESSKHFEECRVIRQKLYERDEGEVRARTSLMLALARVGKTERAVELAEGLEKDREHDPRTLYHIACCYAVCVKDEDALTEKAIEMLAKSLEAGYEGRVMVKLEPDFAYINKLPEFAKVLEDTKD